MTSMIDDLPAIDVHGHYGQYASRSETHPLKQRFMSGDPAVVMARAKAAGIRYTVVSPLRAFVPSPADVVVAANEETQRVVQETEGLLQWVVVHPGQPATFEQARKMLKHPKCMGIKQSLLPGLIEWAVGEVGAEHILLGTDTPAYFAPSQRARIDHADLNDEQKRMILWDNARRILPIPDDDSTKKECN